MDLVFYWKALKHWFWILLLCMAATLYAVFYFENWRGIAWQAETTILVDGPYGLTAQSYDVSSPPGVPGGVQVQYDFTHVAASASVALSTMETLGLPQERPRDLYILPPRHPEWPSVTVVSGDPEGDAANGGLLSDLIGGSSVSNQVAKTRFVVIRALTFDRFGGSRLAEDLSQTYANYAMDEWRNIHSQSAERAWLQMKRHAEQAQLEYEQAQQGVGAFLVANNLSANSAEFDSVPALIDELLTQRANLVSSASSQELWARKSGDLQEEISALEKVVAAEAEELGTQQSAYQAERQRLQSAVAATQANYEQAFANQENARQEITRVAAQGYPSERTTVATDSSAGETSTVDATSNTDPSVATSSSSGSTTSPDVTTITTTESSSETSGGADNDSNTDANVESTTVQRGNTGSSQTTTTTSSPGQRSTTTTRTTTAPHSSTTTNVIPIDGITSEEQATYYLGMLQFATQDAQGALARAQAQLAATERNDPSAMLANQLTLDQAKLDSLRAARSALELASGDSAAGLAALDELIQEKRGEQKRLVALQPRHDQLRNDAALAESRLLNLNVALSRYQRLNQDTLYGANAQIVIPVKTFMGQSNLLVELIFAFALSALIGAAIGITLEYIRVSRAGLRGRNGGASGQALSIPAPAFAPPALGVPAALIGSFGPVGERLVLPDAPTAAPQPRPRDDGGA